MTKEELIAKMAASAGITKVAAGTALQAFTGAVTTSLKKGQRVSLVNFGTFTVARRKARLGRNPRTGEALRIPAAKVPKFSAGKILKSAVRSHIWQAREKAAYPPQGYAAFTCALQHNISLTGSVA